MKRSLFCLGLILTLFPAATTPVCAQTQKLTAQEIVKRSDELMRGKTQEGLYKMTIVTPQWERIVELYVYSEGHDKVFLKILSPAKEKGITTLRIKNEMWDYLPSVERMIKIPLSMMLQPWMGSDFANDDLVKESSVVEDYTHTLKGQEKINGQNTYRIELKSKPQASVTWEKRVMWINKDNFTPVRDEFYGPNNKLIKVLLYSDVKKISDRLIPTRWEMISEVKQGHRTLIEVSDRIVYNKPIADGIFSLQNLKKGS